MGLSKLDEDKDQEEAFKNNFLREFEGTPLLNHASEMYDDEKHVRVRINSSKLFPKDFDKMEATNVVEDRSSVYLRPSTYSKKADHLKSGITEMW